MTDTRRFEGYGVLITGGARGIGAATARRFAREGARVLVADQDPAAATGTARALREEGLTAEGIACDVADRAATEAAVAHAVDTFGSLDVLVNSAAHCSPDAPLFEDEPDESWARDLDVTLSGATAAAVPRCRTWPPPGAAPSSPSARSTACRTSATTPTAPPRQAWDP